MVHFEFGRGRLTQPHELNTFELAQGAIKVPLESQLHARALFPPSGSSLNQLSGPIQDNLNLRRTNVRFLDAKEVLTVGQDRVIMSGL